MVRIILSSGGHRELSRDDQVDIANEPLPEAADAIMQAVAEKGDVMSVVHAISWEVPASSQRLQFNVVAKDPAGNVLVEVKVASCPAEIVLPEGVDVVVEVSAINSNGRPGASSMLAFRTEHRDEVVPQVTNLKQTFVRFA